MKFLMLFLVILVGCNVANDLGVEQYVPPTTNPSEVTTRYPYLQFTQSTVKVSEDSGQVILTVALSDAAPAPITVAYSVSGTASASDFVNIPVNSSGGIISSNGQLIIPEGAVGGVIAFNITDDDLHEPDESIVVTLGSPTRAVLGSVSSTTILIENDEVTPRAIFCDPSDGGFPTNCLADSFVTINEDDTQAIRIALYDGVTAVASGQDIDIPYTITGNATYGTDYAITSGSVTGTTSGVITIPAGTTYVDVTLNTYDDGLAEINENFILTLGSGNGYVVGSPAVFTTTIVSATPPPIVNINPGASTTTIAENAAGNASVRVEYTGVIDQPLTVPYSVTGTATTGIDHELTSGSIVLPPGNGGSNDITFPIKDDFIFEGDETVKVTLGIPNFGTLNVVNTDHTITITENEAPTEISFSVSKQITYEPNNAGGDGSNTTNIANMIVKITAIVSNGVVPHVPVKIPVYLDESAAFTALGKNATKNVDHELAPVTEITIAKGQSAGSVQFKVGHDDIDEWDEKVRILMGKPTNANGCSAVDTAANLATDNPVIANGNYGLEQDTGIMKVGDGVTAWNALPVATIVYEDTYESTDTPTGTFYVLDTGEFRVGNGATQWDSIVASSPSCHLQQVVTITDNDDAPKVSFELTGQNVDEGIAANVNVKLDKRSGKDVTVVFEKIVGDNVTFYDSNPSLTDYSLPAGWVFNPVGANQTLTNNVVDTNNSFTVTIPANQTIASLSFGTYADSVAENNHSFSIYMDEDAIVNATPSAPLVHTVNISDGQTLPIVFFRDQADTYTEVTATPNEVEVVLCLSQQYAYEVTVPIEIDTEGTTAKFGLDKDYTYPVGWLEDDKSTWLVKIPANLTATDPGYTGPGVCYNHSFKLPMINDDIYEFNEFIKLKIGDPTNAITADQNPKKNPKIDETGVLSDGKVTTIEGMAGLSAGNPYNFRVTSDSRVTGAPALAGDMTHHIVSYDGVAWSDLGIVILDESTMAYSLELISDDAAPTIAFKSPTQTVNEDAGRIAVTAQLLGTTKADKDITVPVVVNGASTLTYGVGEDYTYPFGFKIPEAPATFDDTWRIKIPAGESEGTVEFALRDDTDYENPATPEQLIINWNHDAATSSGLQIKYGEDDDSNILPVVGMCTYDEVGTLNNAKILQIQALAGVTPADKYVFKVLNDARSPNTSPAAISGDMAGRYVIWDGTTWSDGLLNTSGACIAETEQWITNHIAYVIENDTVPTISFELVNQTVAENSGIIPIRVLMSGRSYQTTDLTVQTNPISTATALADYNGLFTDINLSSPLPPTYTIPAGTSEFTIYTRVEDDTLAEITETLVLDFLPTSPAEAVIDPVFNRHTLNITDNENLPIVTFQPLNTIININEADGTQTFDIIVELEGSNTSSAPIQVPVSFRGTAKMSTATQTYDYTLPGTPWDVQNPLTWFVEIAPGASSGSVSVTVVDDLTDEPQENILIIMGTPVNAVAGSNTTMTVTINDNDLEPAVSFVNPTQTVVEQNTTIQIPITLDNPSDFSISVAYELTLMTNPAKIDAISGTDHSLVNGRITIPPGTQTVNIPVNIIDDVNFESTEYIGVTLPAPSGGEKYTVSATPGANYHEIEIKDNDLPPRVSFEANFTETNEPASGTKTLQIKAVLDNPSYQNVWVNVEVGNIAGTAEASTCSNPTYKTQNDCTTNGGAWTARDFVYPPDWDLTDQWTVGFGIPAGETQAIANFTIESDSIFEIDETLILTLGSTKGLCQNVPVTIPATPSHTKALCDAIAGATWDTTITTATMGVNPLHTLYITDGGVKPRVTFETPSQIVNEGDGNFGCVGAGGGNEATCEGNGGVWKDDNNAVTVNVAMNVSSAHDVKVPISSIAGYGDDPAKHPDDYTYPSGWSTNSTYNHIITIPANTPAGTPVSVTFTTIADTLIERTEAFSMTMGVPFIQNSTDNYVRKGDITSHVVYINTDVQDEVPDVYFASSKTFAMESSAGATPLLILDAPTAFDVEVNFRVTSSNCTETITMPLAGAISVQRPCGGAAVVDPTLYPAENNGIDFEFYDGTVTIPAGETIVAFPTIAIVDDYNFERDEKFTIEILSVSNAEFGANADTATKQENYRTEVIIVNDDSLPAISFDITQYEFDEVDQSITRQAVLETPGPGKEVKVKVITNGTHYDDMQVSFSILGTATPADPPAFGGCPVEPSILVFNDFSYPEHTDCNDSWTDVGKRTVTIPAGETAAEFSFIIYDDFLYEPDETIIISMLSPTNAFIGPSDTHIITVMDSDPIPKPSFTTINQVVYEPKLCTTHNNNFNYGTNSWDPVGTPNTYEGLSINCGAVTNRTNYGGINIDQVYSGVKSLPIEVKIYVVPETTMIIPVDKLDVKDANTVISGDFFLPNGWSDLVDPQNPNVDAFGNPRLNWYFEIDPEALPICAGPQQTDCCSYKPSNPGSEYGECRKTVNFTLIDDNIYEADDEFTLTMGQPFLYNPPYDSVLLEQGEIYQTTVTILNDTTGLVTKDIRGPLHTGGGNFTEVKLENDPPPTVKFTSNTSTADEMTDPISLNCTLGKQHALDIELSEYSAFDTIVPINVNQFIEHSTDTSKSTAKPGVDHDFVPVYKTIPAGQKIDYETFCIKNDNDTEGAERIVFEIGNPIQGKRPSLATEFRHTVTINHNDPAKVKAGRYHTCAIISEKLRCWGYNDKGQTGYETDIYGTTVLGNEPFDFVNLSSGEYVVEKVDLGYYHTCAMLLYPSDGSKKLKCWGDNSFGQLGIGKNQYGDEHGNKAGDMGDSLPAVYFGSSTLHVKDFAVGAYHTCALLTNNKVHCWGRNNFGQLGYNHNYSIGYDQPEIYLNGPVSTQFDPDQIYAGLYSTCIYGAGEVQCWGYDYYGQASGGKDYCMNEYFDNGTPYPTTFDDIPEGQYFNSTSLTNQSCVSIGDDPFEVGDAIYAPKISDNFSGTHGYPALEVKLNSMSNSTCFKHELGIYTCAGYNAYGQLGRGHSTSIGDYRTDDSCVGATGGDATTCATNGGVWAPARWYKHEYKQSYINDDNNSFDDDADDDTYINFLRQDNNNIVHDVAFMPSDFQVGLYHSCALQEGGEVVCIGRNNYGQRGLDNNINSTTSSTYSNYKDDEVSAGNSFGHMTNIQNISTGFEHSCAVKNSNEIICWGRNDNYNLGYTHNADVGADTVANGTGDGRATMREGSENALVVKPGKGFPTYKDY